MVNRKKLRHLCEWAGARAAVFIASACPRPLARAVGSILGRIAWNAVRIRRGVSRDNVAHALGRDATEATRIAAASYRYLGRAIMEFSAPSRYPPEVLANAVRWSGVAHVDAARAAGRGAVLVTGHFGNWELLGGAIAGRGIPLNFLVGEQTNPLVDDMINALRRRWGVGVIHRGLAMRSVLRALRRGEFVGMLVDQNVRHDGVFVDFLGRLASTTPAPARFCIHTGAPLLPAFIVPDRGGGGYHATVEPAMWPHTGLDREAQVIDLTARYTARLEAWVRSRPDVYFWAHRRWKTRPPGERATAGRG